MTAAIAFLFFVSGGAALLYEILWIRGIGYVLGGSSAAIATVVAAYLTGLALGAFEAGRRSLGTRNGLLLYAGLELLIALTAPFVPWTVRLLDVALLDPLWPTLESFDLEHAARFAVVFLVAVVPTVLMGATLPILCTALAGTAQRPAQVIGKLYGLNTLGGVVGCLLAGFWLLERWGLRASLGAAAALNLGLAAAAFGMHRLFRPSSVAGPGAPENGGRVLDAPPRPLLLAGMVACSFASIAAEILWTRILSLTVGGTTYAFSLVLATFLGGLGLGSLWVGWRARHRGLSSRVLGSSQMLLGIFVLATMASYDGWLASLGMDLHEAESFAERARVSLWACVTIMLLPSFWFGMAFPLLSELWIHHPREMGRGVGSMYLASTAGGVAGSLCTTFALLPRAGLEAALAAVAAGCTLVGAVFYAWPSAGRLRGFLVAAGVLLVAGVLLGRGRLPGGMPTPALVGQALSRESWDPRFLWGGVFLYGTEALDPDRTLQWKRDGTACSVTVWKEDEQWSLAVNGKVDASGGNDMGTQLLLAWLPQLLHADPEQVFVLGYGAGVTAGAAAAYGSEVVCAEIERGVWEASPYFADVNFSAHTEPRVKVEIQDGRALLRRTAARFDVITTEPSNPWMSGMSSLFTEEFYELCRSRLEPGGILCQWVQLYWSSVEDYRSIVATIRGVFPHLMVFQSTIGDTLMVASERSFDLSFAALDQRLEQHPVVGPTLRANLRALTAGPGDSRAYFAAMVLLAEEDVDLFLATPAARILDDRPFLEFTAARSMQALSGGAILGELLAHRRAQPYAAEALLQALTDGQQAWLLRHLGARFLVHDLIEPAKLLLDEAHALDPDLPELAYQRFLVAMRLDEPWTRGELLLDLIRQDGHRLIDAAEEAGKVEKFELAHDLLKQMQRAAGSSLKLERVRATLYEAQGLKGHAAEAWRAVLRFDRNDAQATEALERLAPPKTPATKGDGA